MKRFWRRTFPAAVVGVLAALPMVAWMRGFMVDDALIAARYAANLVNGAGHVFNVGDRATDGVTPFGWAWVLAPFAFGGAPVLHAFQAAKAIGVLAWMVGAGGLGLAIASFDGSRARWLPLALVAASAPLGAWACAGMETGVVLGLGALAASGRALGRERVALGCAALATAWRPELVPWATVLALAPTVKDPRPMAAMRGGKLVAVLAPALLVALCRRVAFGSFAPLSLLAKAPSLRLGAAYTAACWLLTGLLAMVSWRRLPAWARGIEVAVFAHGIATTLAGGDWMPLSRLMVPVLPGAFLVASAALAWGSGAWGSVRCAAALAGELFAFARAGETAATVGEKRLHAAAQLAPLLRGRTVATVDAGWVGTSASRVVDLAGVTDPSVAALPGGHTSKRIPSALLDARGVDAIVLLLAPGRSLASRLEDTHFARWTEVDLAHQSAVAERFCVVGESSEPHYVVLHRCSR